jgi:hypothetical protein
MGEFEYILPISWKNFNKERSFARILAFLTIEPTRLKTEAK